jgi:hypothetical protein
LTTACDLSRKRYLRSNKSRHDLVSVRRPHRLRIGLGVFHLMTRDDHVVHEIDPQRGQRRVGCLHPAARDDRPGKAGFDQIRQQLTHAGGGRTSAERRLYASAWRCRSRSMRAASMSIPVSRSSMSTNNPPLMPTLQPMRQIDIAMPSFRAHHRSGGNGAVARAALGYPPIDA